MQCIDDLPSFFSPLIRSVSLPLALATQTVQYSPSQGKQTVKIRRKKLPDVEDLDDEDQDQANGSE